MTEEITIAEWVVEIELRIKRFRKWWKLNQKEEGLELFPDKMFAGDWDAEFDAYAREIENE